MFGDPNTRGTTLSSLYGAPAGWTAPGPEKEWAPKQVNTAKSEVPFENVDNPGRWSSYTFRPVFQNYKKMTESDTASEGETEDTSSTKGKGKGKGKAVQYLHHAMLCGAIPIPKDTLTGKRLAGGFEFF